ncbi:hypothetical protein E2P81_ATG00922 [Venturia nashicola]|nr:hypothetical protein E2P81_ATG00922 [Venturia nashicola]
MERSFPRRRLGLMPTNAESEWLIWRRLDSVQKDGRRAAREAPQWNIRLVPQAAPLSRTKEGCKAAGGTGHIRCLKWPEVAVGRPDWKLEVVLLVRLDQGINHSPPTSPVRVLMPTPVPSTPPVRRPIDTSCTTSHRHLLHDVPPTTASDGKRSRHQMAASRLASAPMASACLVATCCRDS